MKPLKPPAPAALFLAILYGPTCDDENVPSFVSGHFGEILLQSPVFAFTFSEYYEKEMGRNLRKVFFLLDKLIDPAELPEWKLRALELEEQHAEAGRRTINLDPGYLELPKLVLATTKNFAHRIYLGRGIYADVQLYMRNGNFQANPWTYPDYKHPEHLLFFEQARKKYFEKMKALTGAIKAFEHG